jgi:adenine-specific DNA methylase
MEGKSIINYNFLNFITSVSGGHCDFSSQAPKTVYASVCKISWLFVQYVQHIRSNLLLYPYNYNAFFHERSISLSLLNRGKFSVITSNALP